MLQKMYVAAAIMLFTIGNLLFCIEGIAQKKVKNTVIIEFSEGKVPLEGQLNLQIVNFRLEFKKILRHNETILLHHKDLYIYEFEGNPDELKKNLEDSLYARSRKTRRKTTATETIEGYEPNATDEHYKETGSGAETEEKSDVKSPSAVETKNNIAEDDMHRVSSFCLTSKFDVTFKGAGNRDDILSKYDVKFRKVYSMPECVHYNIEAKNVAKAISVVEQLMEKDFVSSVNFSMFGILELH